MQFGFFAAKGCPDCRWKLWKRGWEIDRVSGSPLHYVKGSEVKSMKLIERKDYLNKLISVIGTPDIKVITGVRRSGKSKLLEAFKRHIQKENPNAIILIYNY